MVRRKNNPLTGENNQESEMQQDPEQDATTTRAGPPEPGESSATPSGAGASTSGAAFCMADMEKLLLNMETRIVAKLSSQLSADREKIARHDETIEQMETSLNDMQARLIAVESTCSDLIKENEAQKLKLDLLENRSRRSNVRITGLGEHLEGTNATAFLEASLKEIFPGALPDTPAIVDRAHRLPVQRRGGQNAAPRPFIAWIHHYQTKELIMKLAREAGRLTFRGSEIHIFNDYSAEVSKKRGEFSAVKSQLRDAGYSYRMFFPHKLQVTDRDGQKTLFQTPGEVATFLQNAGPQTQNASSSD